jgi:drug/metabolite transporter (DMT)-like permease
MNNSTKAILALIIANSLFGFVGPVFRKMASLGAGIFTITFFAWVLSSIFIWIYAKSSKIKFSLKQDKKTTILLIMQGVLSALMIVAFFLAVTNTTIANTEFIHKTMPIWAAIASVFILKENFTLKKFASLALVLIGISFIFSVNIFSGSIFGDSMALISAFLLAAMTIILRLLKNVSPYVTSLYQLIVSSILVFPFMLMDFPIGLTNPGLFILLTFGYAILFSGICLLLVIYGFRHIEASTGSLFVMLTPASAVVLGFFLYGEVLTFKAVIGILLIFASIFLVSVKKGFVKK